MTDQERKTRREAQSPMFWLTVVIAIGTIGPFWMMWVASVRASGANEERIKSVEQLQTSDHAEVVELRKMASNIREDMAEIKGALGIKKK